MAGGLAMGVDQQPDPGDDWAAASPVQAGLDQGAGTAAPPQGPLNQTMAAGGPDVARQSGLIGNAMATLQMARMGGMNPAMLGLGGQSNGINIPLLAAAGAMLSPTRTGGLAEALGNAFTTGAGAEQKQRELEATQGLRMAQMADTQAYREGILGVRGQHEDTYAARAQAMSARDQASAALMQARAAMVGAGHATEGDILNQAVGNLADGKTINPDTQQPWTFADAYRFVKGTTAKETQAQQRIGQADQRIDQGQQRVDQGQQRVDQGDQRLGQGQQRIDNQVTQYQQTQDFRERQLAIQQQGVNERDAAVVVNNAARIVAADVTGRMTMEKALPQALQAYRTTQGQLHPEAPAAAVAAPAAAPAAPTAAAPGAAAPQSGISPRPVVPPRPSTVPPGSSYSPSRNAWRDPTGKTYDATGKQTGG